MKLLFLSGPPAVGKLTIARELATRTGWRLFHNHLTVDLVLSVYDFGTPGFIALREEIWLAVIRRALADQLPGLIFTFNPENSVPQRFIDELFAEVSRTGEVLLVELTAPESVIESRLGAASRHERRKLVDLTLYRQLREAGVFSTPRLPAPRLTVDTETLSPSAAARQIISELGLPGTEVEG
jgi:hypothetical protein